MCIKSPAIRLFGPHLRQANNVENINQHLAICQNRLALNDS